MNRSSCKADLHQEFINKKCRSNLLITWADGVVSTDDVRALRLACACAQCVDEWSGEGRLDPATVPADVRPLRITPVGRYAIQIHWSDGHETGIYPYRRLPDLAR